MTEYQFRCGVAADDCAGRPPLCAHRTDVHDTTAAATSACLDFVMRPPLKRETRLYDIRFTMFRSASDRDARCSQAQQLTAVLAKAQQ